MKARGNVQILMTPGPVEVSPRVLSALSRPTIHHYYKGFIDFFHETEEKLKPIFQTGNDLVIMQGECVLSLEATMASILDPGDKVLVLDSGPFGNAFSRYIKNNGGEPMMLSVDYNDIIEAEALEEILEKEGDIKALTVVHVETPAGTTNPIREICRIGKEHDVLTVVDAVASLGGIEIKTDEWGIDICITASQKCLSSTPGLTILSLSEEAWKAMENKKQPLRQSYLSILDWRETWIKNRRFPYTPFVAEIYGLNEAADEILDEGLDNVFIRHKRLAEATRAGIEGMGLELWPKRREFASDTVTAVEVPEKVDDRSLREVMAERYGVLIAGSLGELSGRVIRIGHMGYSAQTSNVISTIGSLEKALSDLKHPVKMGSGVRAALESLN